MGTQINPGAFDPQDLPADEPRFLLRGQDFLAPALVDLWADQAEKTKAPPEKIAEARRVAEEMRRWPKKKWPD